MVSAEIQAMEQQEDSCIINCLPRDLITRIFLRLPVSSLLRCTSVCKLWYNFIRDPQFVALHLQHAPRCTLLFFPSEFIQSTLYPSDAIIFDEAWSLSTCSVPLIGPDDFLCGSCHGLICLYSKTAAIKIANLATGECLHLDKPAKEYKVVHFLHQKCSRGTFSAVQVYTLGSEKWKDIRAPEALSLSCVKNSGVVVVDGTMYWLTEDTGASWKHAVIALDLSTETFARIQLPAATLGGSSSRRYWITEINGNVGIATAEVNCPLPKLLAGELQIWTLDKNADQRWSQNCSIQHAPNFISGPHFVHGDKIMMQSHNCNLCLYDLHGKNCEMKLSNMVQLFDFSPHKPEKMQCYTCLKSLVRLDAYRKAGVLHAPEKYVGREIKKCEVWKSMLRKLEDVWSSVTQLEQICLKSRQCLAALEMRAKEILQRFPDDVVWQRVCMEIDQVLQNIPDCPYQHPTSVRWRSWFELKGDMEKVSAHSDVLKDMIKVLAQTLEHLSTGLSLQDHLRLQEPADSTG